jgi:hypothetical protein
MSALCTLSSAVVFGLACSSSGGDGGSSNDDAGVDTNVPDAIVDTSNDESAIDAGDGGDASDAPDLHDVYPAFEPSVPQATSLGGPLFGDFTVVPVIYAGDTDGASVPDYLPKYAASPELTAQLTEYGVGKMTVGTTVTISTPAPTTIADADIRTWLLGQLDGTHPEWGATDPATLAKTIYVLVYPPGTTVADRGGGKSCTAFEGYHDSIPVTATADAGTDAGTGAAIFYAPIGRCSVTGLTAPQVLTLTVGHEILEVATDPYATSNPAYHEVDVGHYVWTREMGGGEIADLCSYEPFFWAPPDIGYTIARTWSNVAAKAYRDPCVPAPPGEPYFNSFIDATDAIVLGGTTITKGIRVPVGPAKTFDVNLFSAAATSGPWTVFINERPIGGDPKVLTIALDGSTGVNGDTLHVTLTAKSLTPSGRSALQIVSKLGTQQSLWWVLVSLK